MIAKTQRVVWNSEWESLKMCTRCVLSEMKYKIMVMMEQLSKYTENQSIVDLCVKYIPVKS